MQLPTRKINCFLVCKTQIFRMIRHLGQVELLQNVYLWIKTDLSNRTFSVKCEEKQKEMNQ